MDVVELTLTRAVPNPMGGSIVLPSFPWSPRDVEELTEDDRMAYKELLHRMQEELFKKR